MLGWRKAMAQIGQRRTIKESSFAPRGIALATPAWRTVRGCAAVAVFARAIPPKERTLSAVNTLSGVGHKFLPGLSQI